MKKLFRISFAFVLLTVTACQVQTDQDNIWKSGYKGITGGSIEMIIVNPLDNYIYAATGGGILKSIDKGEHCLSIIQD